MWIKNKILRLSIHLVNDGLLDGIEEGGTRLVAALSRVADLIVSPCYACGIQKHPPTDRTVSLRVIVLWLLLQAATFKQL